MRHATRTTSGVQAPGPPSTQAPHPRPQTLRAPLRLLLIFLGGAAGALLRTALLFPAAHPRAHANPLLEAALLLGINVAGAFLLGVLVSSVTGRTPRADAIRALLGTGLLGGFTSYSSLVLLALPAGGAWPTGFWLAVSSLVLGLAAAWAGFYAGTALRKCRLP